MVPSTSEEFVKDFVVEQGSRFRLVCVDLCNALQACAYLYATLVPVPRHT